MVSREAGMLPALAEHNAWANRKIFEACSAVDGEKLQSALEGYDSVISILTHLVHVEHAFFELAHGRAPSRIGASHLSELSDVCARIDQDYVEYTRRLQSEAREGSFLVPWFGFEVTLLEGIIQPLTHSHKHRADVSMLLPRLGGTGIEMDFIQWLDEQRGSE